MTINENPEILQCYLETNPLTPGFYKQMYEVWKAKFENEIPLHDNIWFIDAAFPETRSLQMLNLMNWNDNFFKK